MIVSILKKIMHLKVKYSNTVIIIQLMLVHLKIIIIIKMSIYLFVSILDIVALRLSRLLSFIRLRVATNRDSIDLIN